MNKARNELDPDYFYSEHDSTGEGDQKSKLDKRVDELVEYAIEELQQPHCGDCTCVAMTCGKCMAEEKLDLYTNKGLGKHSASYVESAFGANHKNDWAEQRNIHEAIEYLENHDAAADPPDWEGWEPHVERWNREAAEAAKWLRNYRDTRFPQ